MNTTDKQAFAGLLGDALGFYGQTVTPFSMSVWWQACERFELGQVAKALTAHAMDAERGHFAPKPADIVRQLQGTQADRSLIAWGKVLDAMQRVGAYRSVAFDDGAIHAAIEDMGGWPKVCRSTMDELPFVQRRFTEAHRAYSSREGATHPALLLGEHESINRLQGKRVAPPMLVGNPERAKEVMSIGVTGTKTQITLQQEAECMRIAFGVTA